MTRLERSDDPARLNYSGWQDVYHDIRVGLSAARVRAAAIPKNELTTQQIDEVIKVMGLFEQMHKEGIRKEEIEPVRRAVNSQFTAILKLELAKKRGEAK